MTSSFLRVHSFSKAMNKYNLGKNLLFAGCFLLPTSGYIGPFLILLACICGSSLQGFKALFVKKMYPLYVLSALILMSAFASPFGLRSCGGIFNWLPFFWLFWSLSIYLRDKNNIKRVAMNLAYGTIPVLIFGFSQLIFGFNESLRIFGSFVVWHVLDNGEFTGVFYNRNICAAWLAASFPFFVAAIRFQIYLKEDILKKIVAWLALCSVSIAMILTNFRNAIGSLILGSFGMIVNLFSANQAIGRFNFYRLSALLLLIAIVLSLSICFGLVNPALDAINQFLANEGRLEIWRFGVLIASNNFFVGSGPGGFTGYASVLSSLSPRDASGDPFNHVHSLPLDLWVSYGFIALAIFLVYVFAWLYKAIRSGMLQESPFSKAWLISFVLLIIVHVTDLPYLDARINLVGWILFAGIVSCAESSALASAESSDNAFD